MLNLILSVSDDYDSRLVILPFPHQINIVWLLMTILICGYIIIS
jgi:hypothetical protein